MMKKDTPINCILAFRTHYKLTQKFMAHRVNECLPPGQQTITNNCVSRYERGEIMMKDALIIKAFCEVMDVTPQFLKANLLRNLQQIKKKGGTVYYDKTNQIFYR